VHTGYVSSGILTQNQICLCFAISLGFVFSRQPLSLGYSVPSLLHPIRRIDPGRSPGSPAQQRLHFGGGLGLGLGQFGVDRS